MTSANLTEAAFDRNIELGLLVRDRTLAATTLMHFRTLIEKNLRRRLPAAERVLPWSIRLIVDIPMARILGSLPSLSMTLLTRTCAVMHHG